MIATLLFALVAVSLACTGDGSQEGGTGRRSSSGRSESEGRLAKYTSVRLTADLSGLTDNQRRMIPLLIEAAEAMDEAFWLQAYGDKREFLEAISDPGARRFAGINYGPWDRLAGNEPFIAGVGSKPEGATFYPSDMTKEEFDAAVTASEEKARALKSLYTIVRRDDGGGLVALPYRDVFAPQVQKASAKLMEASALAEDTGFRNYLELRAQALLTDEYRSSDLAWMDMKENAIDIVIGPIETYEDSRYGYKAAYEAYVLLKDFEWSRRLTRYAMMLPALQRGLPVPDPYKQETPGANSDLNAYDVLYYAGDCNAGSKTIAINLPNDEEVQLQKGTRRLQLKNAMKAKFDEILQPIAGMLIAEDQRRHVTFDAFFSNTMFHEIAHGLGIKNTIAGKMTVRQAMKKQASALEEGKADVLGLYMVTKLHEQGELDGTALEDHYVTFLAGIFRSSRFGTASAHGRANMLRFNFFKKMGAFARDYATGTYRVDMDRMKQAADALSEKILRFQGDGDYEGVEAWVAESGRIGLLLQADLDRLAMAGIPVDIVFEQGTGVLGLN
ncbi:MAG: Zn-dependent hydrolase [Acidobacteria bacterium]|nr:Zn-dependent hydrolase [Acidobacteriota bacterium]